MAISRAASLLVSELLSGHTASRLPGCDGTLRTVFARCLRVLARRHMGVGSLGDGFIVAMMSAGDFIIITIIIL